MLFARTRWTDSFVLGGLLMLCSSSAGAGSADFVRSGQETATPASMSVFIRCAGPLISAEQLVKIVARVLREDGYDVVEMDVDRGIVSTDWKRDVYQVASCGLKEKAPRRIRLDIKVSGSPPVIVAYPQTQHYADPVSDWCELAILDGLRQDVQAWIGSDAQCAMTVSAGFATDDGPVDVPPKPTHMEPPQFPRRATEGALSAAELAVLALVDSSGRVLLALPFGGTDKLRAAVLKAAMKSRFEPAQRAGSAVAAWICIPYKFGFVG